MLHDVILVIYVGKIMCSFMYIVYGQYLEFSNVWFSETTLVAVNCHSKT